MSDYHHDGSHNNNRTNIESATPQVSKRDIRRLKYAEHQHHHSTEGLSEVEELSLRIQHYQEARIPVTLDVRKRFLHRCTDLAFARGFHSKITLTDLASFRDEVRREVEVPHATIVIALMQMGICNDSRMLLEVLDRAVQRAMADGNEQNFFFYQDFLYFHTSVISRWPWARSQLSLYLLIIVAYYAFTPLLFCVIAKDKSICPDVDDKGEYGGWLTALYFASTTLSTVGYGDVSVIDDENAFRPSWHVFVGTMFMILSAMVFVTAISTLVSATSSPLDSLHEWAMNYFVRSVADEKFLYELIRRTYYVKLAVIVFEFTTLNLIGVFVARSFIVPSEEPDEQWSWMTTLYWAIQTTTTIGYGDLSMPFNMRWVQIVFLIFSTYFVGDSLRRLGKLSSEIEQVRRVYAWDHRDVSKGLIIDMDANKDSDTIDQYEYCVGSLLALDKISHEDIQPIMEKFRRLAGGRDYISIGAQRLDSSDMTMKTDSTGNLSQSIRDDQMRCVYG